jgi:hypothetical protein
LYMKLKYDSAGVSALGMDHLTCQGLYKHRRPTKNVCWSYMHHLFCRSHLYVHKIRTLAVPDGNLPSAEDASHSTVPRGFTIGVRWTFSKMTVRRSEHVRHEEDLKGHLAPFLPDCSLVSAD